CVQRRIEDVYKSLADAAPDAQILVLGYPNFFPPTFTAKLCDASVLGSDAVWGSGLISEVDSAIEVAVKSLGLPNLVYVAPSANWDGHDICQLAAKTWFVQPDGFGAVFQKALAAVSKLSVSQWSEPAARLLSLLAPELAAVGGGVSTVLQVLRDIDEPAFSDKMFFHPNMAGQKELACEVLQNAGPLAVSSENAGPPATSAGPDCAAGALASLAQATVPTSETVTEPSEGTTTVTATIVLSAPAGEQATVDYTTENGTAIAGTDYTAASGTLTIPPGDDTGHITVPILAGGSRSALTFTVKLSDPVNMQLSATSVTVTILPASSSASPPVALLFKNNPLSAPASAKVNLGPLTVELVDGSANATRVARPTVVALSSSSATGIFATSPSGTPVRSLTIPGGQSAATFFYGDTSAGTPTLTASAPGLKSATQRERIGAAAPSKLVITSTPVEGEVGPLADLGPITVSEEDTYGHLAAAPAGGTTVTLSSTSPGGVFATVLRGALVRSLSIPAGSTSAAFYYGDRDRGTPTITASSPGLGSARQKEAISGQPQALGACRPGDWTDIWTGKSKAQPNDFDAPANWSLGLPGRTDNVCISSATVPLISGGTETVGSIETFVPLSLAALTITHAPPPSSTTSQASAFHANVSVAGKLSFAGPAVVDGAGTLFTWTGFAGTGPMSGAGSLQVNSGATLELVGQAVAGSAPPTFSLSRLSISPGAGLEIKGYIEAQNCVVTSAGTMTLGQSAIFGATPEPANGVAAPVVVNTGEIVNTGTTVLSNGMTGWLFGDLRLAGKVAVDAGYLVLDTTSTERSTASFSVAEGTGLDLEASTGATLTVGGASAFSGQGELESGHGYSGGTVVVSGRLGLPAVEVYHGTLDLDTNATLSRVTLDGDGTLGGTGDLAVSPGGSLTTSGSGVLSVSGDVTIDAGAALDLGGSPVLNGKGAVMIDKGATATVEGSALVDIGQSVVNDGVLDLVTGGPQQTAGVIACGQAGRGSLTNYGSIDLAGDSSIFPVHEASALNCVLTNKGTVAKSAGTGTSVLGGVPDNAGTITIKSGTVTLLNTSGDDVPVQTATSTGTFDVAAGASLALANTYAGS
ncbi:MAG TPA: Calx-beta domain-containing protein, partial [Acidimicrobiales bacterium]|nr:Calx-beta domain-containing protein [Acidimicrobiales bacterium]